MDFIYSIDISQPLVKIAFWPMSYKWKSFSIPFSSPLNSVAWPYTFKLKPVGFGSILSLEEFDTPSS